MFVSHVLLSVLSELTLESEQPNLGKAAHLHCGGIFVLKCRFHKVAEEEGAVNVVTPRK